MPAQNPFDYVGIPGFDPYLPGAQQRYGDLSTQGRLDVLGEKRKREEKIAQQEQAQQVLQQIYQQYPDKPELAVVELRRRGFLEQADKLETHVSQQKKSVLDQRLAELNILRAQGQIDGDAAEREAKAIAAKSPLEILKIYAGAPPEQIETATAIARFQYGDKAEPIIAELQKLKPEEIGGFAGRVVMGPAAVADDARQAAANAATAANQARDDQRAAEAAAATEAYRKALLKQGDQRIAQSGGRGGGGAVSASDRALATSVFANPASYATLTPTLKSRIQIPLAELGFDFEKYGRGATIGRPVLASDARIIADFNTSLNEADALTKVIGSQGSTGLMPSLGANAPKWVTSLTGFGVGAKQRLATIAIVKQIIGKALEGGVLREHDEEKYKDILPTIDDTTEVVNTKLNGLKETIERKRQAHIDSLSDAGFDTNRFQARIEGSNKTPPRPPGVPETAVWTPDASRPGGGYWKAR